MISNVAGRAGTGIVAVSVAIVILAVSIAPFLNPVWVSFEQTRSEAAAWTGYTDQQVRTATDGILADLVFGPPTFDVSVEGQAVLNERERSHMADVRGVFGAFALLAAAAVIVVLAGWLLARRRWAATFWRSVRVGASGLTIGILVAGAVGLFAFDLAFEVFHRLFFAGGTYDFDPRTDRLVQLFPDRFWFETSIAVGVVVLALCGVTWLLAGWRLREPTPMTAAAARAVEVGR